MMKLHALLLFFAVLTVRPLVFVICQTCLSNPNELAWIKRADGYYGTLTFDAQTFTSDGNGYPAGWVSRVHNGTFPSPTLRMKRGETYYVTLINNLGPESPDNPTTDNKHKDPNTTNLHTHGLHISSESPGDNVFSKILPGESYTYTYNIPCNHAGGLAWYVTNFYFFNWFCTATAWQTCLAYFGFARPILT